MKEQGVLALKGPRRPSFSNFVVGPNAALVDTLQHGLETSGRYFLAGPPGSGRSHLLNAVLAQRHQSKESVAFVALAIQSQHQMLDYAEGDWVVIDDIDALAGQADGEMALFNALNRWRSEKTGVVMAAAGRDRFELPDLRSRLGQATRLTLKPLGDDDLHQLIKNLARDYEVALGQGAADYLLSRTSRNAASIARLIETLAQRALSERRRVSVPLIREMIR